MAVPAARLVVSIAVLLLTAVPAVVCAQAVQVAPFGGYRFGGGLYETSTGATLDVDGAPAAGVMVDIFVKEDTSVSFVYSRQQARVEGPGPLGSTVQYGTLFVEHWSAGATQELDPGRRVRPFLVGMLGLTRFGGPHDSDVRFSLAGGAGVKLMASPHLGARLEGRLYAVFADARLGPTICGGGGCVFNPDVYLIWQAEFTTGLVVSF